MKTLLMIAVIAMTAYTSDAQLYSSGNNVIAGNNVGIGLNAPLAKYHVYGNTLGSTEIRLQHAAATGSARFAFFADNGTAFTTTNDFTVMNKYTAATPGILTPGFPMRSLYAFSNSKGGLFFATSANVGFGQWTASTNTYTTRMIIDSATGNIGIGTVTPLGKLQVHSTLTGDTIKLTNATTGNTLTDGLDIRTTGNAASIMNRENSSLGLGTNNTTRMTIDAAGNVVIGTTNTPTGYKLFVETGILTEKVKVAVKTSANWSDYVFADYYDLKPLSEVEAYVKVYKHLPGIPSAEDVVKDGIDLATMDAKLLEKIEELTLHLIQMEKQITRLNKENIELQAASSTKN